VINIPTKGGPCVAKIMGICWASPSDNATRFSEKRINPTKTETRTNSPVCPNRVYRSENAAPISIIATKNKGLDSSF
jgi:hypothetical protein